MLNLVIGIALGAAFAPFWIKIWNWSTAKIKSLFNKEQ